MAVKRNWTAPEVRAALALYLVTPFGKFHKTNPAVISLAGKIGRTASAVALKLSNLAALDDSLPQKGMANASAMDREVWAEFLSDPDFVLRASNDAYLQPGESFDGHSLREGTDRIVETTARAGQSYFRDMILTSYSARCALTGIEEPKLLVASHIVGWAEDTGHRLNPRNGICLNALHDKAFDRHLITFDERFEMVISDTMPRTARERLGEVRALEMPARFLPDQNLLERHRAVFHDLQFSTGG